MPGAPTLPCRRPAGVVPAALLLAVAASLLLNAPAAPNTRSTLQQGYVVVFKRGFDGSRVRALCDADSDTAVGGARLQGLCRHRYSSLLNGFAGACRGDVWLWWL